MLLAAVVIGADPRQRTSITLAQGGEDPVELRRKDIVRRILVAAYGNGDTDAMDAVYIPEFVRRPGGHDLLTVKKTIFALRAAIPDMQATVPLIVAEGDLVAARLKLWGTFANELVFPNSIPIPASTQPITLLTNLVVRFDAQDLIVEEWDGFDNLGFLVQIGAIPPPDVPASALPDIFQVQPSPHEQRNKDAMRAYFSILSQGNVAVIEERLRPDVQAFSVFGLMNRDIQRSDLVSLRNAMPDLVFQVDALLADGDWVAALYRLRGTFAYDYIGINQVPIPPSNNQIDALVVTFYRFDEQGQVVQSFELYDSWNFLTQLGLTLPRVPSN
jgi:predicted ester cyclase